MEINYDKYYKVQEVKTGSDVTYTVYAFESWIKMILNIGIKYKASHKTLKDAEEQINRKAGNKVISDKIVFSKTVK